MPLLTTAAPSFAFILVLGMRHGLDPDHLAAIDGLTLRASRSHPRWAPAMGGLFALGHGIVIMGIIAATATASARWRPSELVFAWLEWLPPLLLVLLAGLNARELLRGSGYRLAGLRRHLLPGRLGRAEGPLPAVLVGMVFALVFDTALQAAAWGYAAASLGGISAALATGAVFTVGMACTDWLDGWVSARVLRSGRQDAMVAFRRRMGWPIVALCLVVSGYMITSRLHPGLEIPHDWYGVLGAVMMTGMAGLYGFTLYRLRALAPAA